jgi:hypothetical protein
MANLTAYLTLGMAIHGGITMRCSSMTVLTGRSNRLSLTEINTATADLMTALGGMTGLTGEIRSGWGHMNILSNSRIFGA